MEVLHHVSLFPSKPGEFHVLWLTLGEALGRKVGMGSQCAGVEFPESCSVPFAVSWCVALQSLIAGCQGYENSVIKAEFPIPDGSILKVQSKLE